MTKTVEIDDLIDTLGKIVISLSQISGDLPIPIAPLNTFIYDGNITNNGVYPLIIPDGYTLSDLKEICFEVLVMSDTLNPTNTFYVTTSSVFVNVSHAPIQIRIPSKYETDFDTINIGFETYGGNLNLIVSSMSHDNIISFKPIGKFY